MTAFTNSASSTTTGSAQTWTSATRWAYISVVNHAGATPGTVYVRTDGTAAVAGADGTYAVANGEELVFANALPLWTQAASVIPASTSGAGAYTVPSGSGPSEVVPMGSSPYGQSANPGTSVSVIGVAGADYTISGTG